MKISISVELSPYRRSTLYAYQFLNQDFSIEEQIRRGSKNACLENDEVVHLLLF